MEFNLADVNAVDVVDGVDHVDIIRIPRQIYVRADYFEIYSDQMFLQRFRITKATALVLLEQVEHALEYVQDKNNSLSPILQLLLTLRIYATGGHLLTVADFIHCDKSTACRTLAKVTRAIAGLYRQYIFMPRNPEEIAKRQNDFYEVYGFPKVIGAIDGSHIKILSPGGEDPEVYRNRKGYFSINIQAVTTSDLLFQDLVARWPGSTHDATIFNNSRIKHRFENGDFGNSVILGDSGYMNKPYLLTPFLNPQNHGERNYNRCHIQTRVKVEHLFGVWKRRFPIMAYGCRLKLTTTLEVIVATAVLHNMCRLQGDPEPPVENEVMEHELQQLINDGEIPNPQLIDENVAFDHRRNLVDHYFSRI